MPASQLITIQSIGDEYPKHYCLIEQWLIKDIVDALSYFLNEEDDKLVPDSQVGFSRLLELLME